MDLQQNKTVVRHLFEVINNGELDQLRDLVDVNVVDHNAVIFMQPEGPGAAKEGIRLLRQGFPCSRINVEELVAEGDQAAARLTMSGTNTGRVPGASPPQPSSTSEAAALRDPAHRRRQSDPDPRYRRSAGPAHQLGILPDIG